MPFSDDVTIIFPLRATNKLEADDDEDDADAGTGELGARSVVPAASDEAGIDSVPVPEHLNSG